MHNDMRAVPNISMTKQPAVSSKINSPLSFESCKFDQQHVEHGFNFIAAGIAPAEDLIYSACGHIFKICTQSVKHLEG
tara:strand:- start:81 stop:314 length:234 start_codon:yes stop_codon:yes gene_type:complete